MIHLILFIGGLIFFIFPNRWGFRICLILIALVAWHIYWLPVDVFAYPQSTPVLIERPVMGTGPDGFPCVKYNDRGRIVQTPCPSFKP